MITLRPVGTRGLGSTCYTCGDLSGRSPGIQGLRGLGKGALGVLSRLGEGPSEGDVAAALDQQTGAPVPSAMRPLTTLELSIGLGVMAVGAGLAGYHGYKRSGGKVGSTIGWGFLGGLIPIITVPVALAQGYGRRKGR